MTCYPQRQLQLSLQSRDTQDKNEPQRPQTTQDTQDTYIPQKPTLRKMSKMSRMLPHPILPYPLFSLVLFYPILTYLPRPVTLPRSRCLPLPRAIDYWPTNYVDDMQLSLCATSSALASASTSRHTRYIGYARYRCTAKTHTSEDEQDT
jgi:hypothetical protein